MKAQSTTVQHTNVLDELIDNAVIIKKGKKDVGRTIPMSDVISSTLVKPSFFYSGCIHIQVRGAKTYSTMNTNTVSLVSDVNAICFRKPQSDEAQKFKAAIDKALIDSHAQSQALDTDALHQLKQLLDEGVITQDDFDKKKAQLLGI